MSTDDYLDGYGGNHRTAPPRQGQPGWVNGNSDVPVRAMCCNACGSIDIKGRDNGRTRMAQRFECSACGNAWRASPHIIGWAIIIG